TDRQIDSLHEAMGRGFRTVQNLQDPPPVVTLRRRDASGTFGDALTADLISIRMLSREERASAPGGQVDHELAGELRGWAILDVRRDDRFVWGGHTCRVT